MAQLAEIVGYVDMCAGAALLSGAFIAAALNFWYRRMQDAGEFLAFVAARARAKRGRKP